MVARDTTKLTALVSRLQLWQTNLNVGVEVGVNFKHPPLFWITMNF